MRQLLILNTSNSIENLPIPNKNGSYTKYIVFYLCFYSNNLLIYFHLWIGEYFNRRYYTKFLLNSQVHSPSGQPRLGYIAYFAYIAYIAYRNTAKMVITTKFFILSINSILFKQFNYQIEISREKFKMEFAYNKERWDVRMLKQPPLHGQWKERKRDHLSLSLYSFWNNRNARPIVDSPTSVHK